MNPRIEKIKDEIEKTKDKVNKGQIRLRELEKQLTDLENADIVAAIRGVDIAPEELAAFVQMFKAQQQGGTVPNMAIATTPNNADKTPQDSEPATNNKTEEDLNDEN